MPDKKSLPDQVILVDKNDQPLGVMDKTTAHRHPAQLHRASSVLLHNSHNKWLIQQRSEYKIVGANKWANACCGNVRPGEDYLTCAHRRLKEELGIEGVELKKITKFIYQVWCNQKFGEHEVDTVFVGQYDGEVNLNPQEVQAIRWLTKEELLAELNQQADNFAPWTTLVIKQTPNFQ